VSLLDDKTAVEPSSLQFRQGQDEVVEARRHDEALFAVGRLGVVGMGVCLVVHIDPTTQSGPAEVSNNKNES